MTKFIILSIEVIKKIQEKKSKRNEKPVEDSFPKKSRICRPSDFKSRKICVVIDSGDEEQIKTT